MRKLALAVAAATLAGCYEATIRAPVQAAPMTYTDTGVSLLWGLTASRTDAIECPSGIARVTAWQPWWSRILVEPLTIGIVAVIKREYSCAASRADAPASYEYPPPPPPGRARRRAPAPPPSVDPTGNGDE